MRWTQGARTERTGPVRRRRRRVTALVAILVGGTVGMAVFSTTSDGFRPPADPGTLGSWWAASASPLRPRISSSVVWSGTDLLVWGGRGCTDGRCDQPGPAFEDGAAYDVEANRWRPLPTSPLAPRSGAVGAWTGREMLIWGGVGATPLSDGAAYDAAADRWRVLPEGPLAGGSAQAVWTGQELLVWPTAGVDASGTPSAAPSGAAYDPATDIWRPLKPGPLRPRSDVTMVWTGREMLVWGGSANGEYFSDGAAYDPATDRWRGIGRSPLGARVVRGTWTGRELLIWGGEGGPATVGDGAAYDPATDMWRPLAPAPLGPRRGFAAVWTGRELLVWGGAGAAGAFFFGDGAAYDPDADRWRSVARWPGRFIPTSFWTGREMLVWGGIVPSAASDHASRSAVVPAVDGARYAP